MENSYDFFERLVYRSLGGQRFTQSSPITPDVWIHYGMRPGTRLPLLLSPDRDTTPGELAEALRSRFERHEASEGHRRRIEAMAARGAFEGAPDRGPRIAYNQTVAAADLYFHEAIRVALPLSVWWCDYLMHGAGSEPAALFQDAEKRSWLRRQILDAWKVPNYSPKTRRDLTVHLVWLARVVGTLELVHHYPQIAARDRLVLTGEVEGLTQEDLDDEERRDELLVEHLFDVFRGIEVPSDEKPPTLLTVHRNRMTTASVVRSGPAVKADATRRVFHVDGSGITWAVLDTGIDATHWAFRKRDPATGKPKVPAFEKKRVWLNHTRVKATYDFVHIRELLCGDAGTLPDEVLKRVTKARHKDLARVVRSGRVVDWELLRDWLTVPHETDRYQVPRHPHGTHVGGILGADWRPDDSDSDDFEAAGDVLRPEDRMTGVAPGVEFVDVRVLDGEGRADEFSLMAGMQFVRHLNAIHDERQVHGVNLSFSLRHNYSVFACGRTPVCQEAERLVGTGTVVVAAAGNEGMARFQVIDDPAAGTYHVAEGNRSISITDPGNTEAVITVGATHRRDPHTYGVSYFSSRGPTGDGRKKPDLVAPGENIKSTWPNQTSGEMDGTSQAAPHVSGAAALLMHRNPEMIGQPDFVKRVLCETATDLGRERYFQGAGMLDILRALQSV